MKKTYCLIDGSGYIFRAFYALPPMNKSDGTPINAVYGFSNMLFSIIKNNTPPCDYCAVVLDAKRKTFRNDIYPEYKATRIETPEELKPQFPIIREAIEAFNLPYFEMEGYEADDIIATFAKKITDEGDEVVIVTADKDLLQMLSLNIKIWDPMKNKYLSNEDAIAKFGVLPDKVMDVQSLMGDSVDNIPGVPGIGVKTAANLITEFGSFDNLMQNIDKVKSENVKEKLKNGKNLAEISRKLVMMKTDVPIHVDFEKLKHGLVNKEVLLNFATKHEFKSLKGRIASWDANEHNKKHLNEFEQEEIEPLEKIDEMLNKSEIEKTKQETNFLNYTKSANVDYLKYELIDDENELKKWISDIKKQGFVAVDTETDNINALLANIIGVSMALSENKACYIPLQHKDKDYKKENLFDDNDKKANNLKQIPIENALKLLKEILEDENIIKIGHNIKYDMHVFSRYGIFVNNTDDTYIMSYTLDNVLHKHNLDELSYLYFKHENIHFEDVCGTGKNKITFDYVPLLKAKDYSAEDSDMTIRLYELLSKRLRDEKMIDVYEKLDRPLIPVLHEMEENGIKVDVEELKNLSNEFAKEMIKLEKEIYEISGEHFNIASPKQMGEVLFEKMGIPYENKKTKTGEYSTDAGILEDLAAEGHDIAKKIVAWRGYAKLKSTYADALVREINPNTLRVHTDFLQGVVLSGRLSSANPNLQNIPIKTDDGKKIRRAFIADKNCKLISADYSQVELRIMAEIANVKNLKQAFVDGKDIHKATASQIFSVEIDKVDSSMRRIAKTVNFSLIYGSTHFGLARNLGIPRVEAKAYIDAYFKSYPEILQYMEKAKKEAINYGYVKTIMGRKCYITGASNPRTKGNAERAAINAPIQGSAADIMRLAMIKIYNELKNKKFKTRMLLQVHDELIFEAPNDEVDEVSKIVKHLMENAAPELNFILPAEVGVGYNWGEAH